jgi:hypothetical protein
LIDGEIRASLDTAFRPIDEAKKWVPRLDMLSNDELEKLLISQERNIRYECHSYSFLPLFCSLFFLFPLLDV